MMLPIEAWSVRTLGLFYADPGSGALLWQLVGSFFIGLIFYVRRIAAWVSPHKEDERNQDAITSQE